MSTAEQGYFTTKRKLVLFAAVIVLSVLPALLHLVGLAIDTPAAHWRNELLAALEGDVEPLSYAVVQGATAYTLLEWTVVLLGAATAVLAYLHFHVKQEVISLLVAISTFWVAAITAFHLLAFHGFSVGVQNPEAFVQFNWTVGRGFTGLLLVVATALVLWRGNHREELPATHAAMIILVFSVVAYLVIFATARAPELPMLHRPDEFLSRPLDLIPLALFVVALVWVLPALHRMCNSTFSMALWLAAIPLVATQLYMAFLSHQLFDAGFTSAQLTRVLAFGIIFSGLALDYMQRCRSEINLRSRLSVSDRRLRMLFENADEAIVIFDEQARVVDWNRRACEIFEFSSADADTVDAIDLLFGNADGEREQFERRLRRFDRNGDPTPLKALRDLVLIRDDGSEVSVEYSVVPSTEHDKTVFALLARDVSQRKELQLRMFQMDRLVAAGTVAAGVVHEVKNPLTYVVTNLQLVRETIHRLRSGPINQLGDELREHPDATESLEELDDGLNQIGESIESADEGSQRVSRIVDDMRTFSRTDRGQLQPVNACDAAKLALRITRGQVKRHARIETDLQTTDPVLADETRLSQVFVNLIINASQAMERHEGDDHLLQLNCFQEDDQVVIAVCDTGGGIPPSLQPKIFRPFFTTKPTEQGTGLGLSLSKSIVENYGGTIEVESTPGEGTDFIVRLPVVDG